MYKVYMRIDRESYLYGVYETKEKAEEVSDYVSKERNVYTYIKEE